LAFFEKMGHYANAMKQVDIRNLRKLGYPLIVEGRWGGGDTASSSPRAREEQLTLIDSLAGKLDPSLRQKDRNTLAQDLVRVLFDKKQAKRLAKLYDPDGDIVDPVREYAEAFKEYEAANAAAMDKYRAANKVMQRIAKSGPDGAANISGLQQHLAAGVWTDEELEKTAELVDASGIRGDDAEAIMDYARSLRDVHVAHKKSQDAFTDNMSKVDSQKLQKFNQRVKAAEKRVQGKVSRVQEWFDALDLDPDMLDEAGDKTKKAFKKLRKTVSDDDVAKRLGFDSLKLALAGGKSEEEITRARFGILKDRLSADVTDEDAAETFKAFKVASSEGTVRMKGKLVIESGNYQLPATVEGNMVNGLTGDL
jgi:ferritin-like metal-binding protein YciE